MNNQLCDWTVVVYDIHDSLSIFELTKAETRDWSRWRDIDFSLFFLLFILLISCTKWKIGWCFTMPLSGLSFLSSLSKSLVHFVVSSPWLALNADVKDELLGYAADVRVSAVSCLQIHLEIDILSFTVPFSFCCKEL